MGKRILIRTASSEPEWVEIIGVAAHERGNSLAVAGREQIYFIDGFLRHGRVNRWALARQGDPARSPARYAPAIGQHDPIWCSLELQPMDTLVENAQAGTRFRLLLIGVFAVIAALLAARGTIRRAGHAGAAAHGGNRCPHGAGGRPRRASSGW